MLRDTTYITDLMPMIMLVLINYNNSRFHTTSDTCRAQCFKYHTYIAKCTQTCTFSRLHCSESIALFHICRLGSAIYHMFHHIKKNGMGCANILSFRTCVASHAQGLYVIVHTLPPSSYEGLKRAISTLNHRLKLGLFSM
jgi:hypothetical protein